MFHTFYIIVMFNIFKTRYTVGLFDLKSILGGMAVVKISNKFIWRQQLEKEQVKETYKNIEPGVRKFKPKRKIGDLTQSEVYVYKLDEMSEESIEKYGLTEVYEEYKNVRN